MDPMARERVGTVAALWRYPVKSMGGQEVEVSAVNERGLNGDRAYALLDARSGKVASAKNPRPWAPLLEFQATYLSPPDTHGLPPPWRSAHLKDSPSTATTPKPINACPSPWDAR